jgi:hypothetical protein
VVAAASPTPGSTANLPSLPGASAFTSLIPSAASFGSAALFHGHRGMAVAATATFPPGSAAVAFALRIQLPRTSLRDQCRAGERLPLRLRFLLGQLLSRVRCTNCCTFDGPRAAVLSSVHVACTGQTSGRGAVVMTATPPTYGCGAARERGRRAVAGLSP